MSFDCDPVRAGDESRNVLSVIDPELPCRWTPGRPPATLPFEDVEPCLCIIRLVCTSETGVGDAVSDRSAAAAAADERFALETRFARNA